MSKTIRAEATAQGWKLGWSYLALNGKRPIEKKWTERDREDIDEAVSWAMQTNVGIRTGKASGGLIVVDIDRGADVSQLDLPDTITVITGSGGLHLYYRTEVEIKNSASKIAPKVDIRGDGGQVVAVGSIHPETNKMYRYARDLSPKEITAQPLPQWIVERLNGKTVEPPRIAQPRRVASKRLLGPEGGTRGYWSAALAYEAEKVSSAGEGERNDTLNRASFSMGTIIGAKKLDRIEVESILMDAAMSCGLPIDEATKTISSGIDAGMRSPRELPSPAAPEARSKQMPDDTVDGGEGEQESQPDPEPASNISVTDDRKPVMIPGSHYTAFGYKEVGNDQFAADVISTLPIGVIYRRGGLPVEFVGSVGHRRLQIVSVDRMRLIIDEHVRLVQCCRKQNKLQQIYKNATRNLSSLVLAAAGEDSSTREIILLTHYPVYGPDWELAKPGWCNGVFYDEPPELIGMTPRDGGWEIIEDLIVDFPFASEVEKFNFISLLMTPMIRPAVLGNVPMFLIKSSLPRTGKTKLAEQVTGGIYLGEETPSMQWSTNEDERDKRILSILKQGDTILHVDNVSAYVDSPALASLVTSKFYQGRLLGQSQMMRIENTLTIIATANNPRATGEIVRRACPITLQPANDSPELRADFKHPNLFKHVLYRRPRIWSVMTGLVEAWKARGKPATGMKMGGFEGWAETMSGIMFVAGAESWMSNWRGWVKEADPEGEDLKEFVTTWWQEFGESACHAKELLKIAEEKNLFGSILIRSRTDQGRLTIFASDVLIKYSNAPVEDYIIRRASGRSYVLSKANP